MAADALGPPRAPRPCWAVIRRFGRAAARDPPAPFRFRAAGPAGAPLGGPAAARGGSPLRVAGRRRDARGGRSDGRIDLSSSARDRCAGRGGVVHLCGGLQYGAGPWIAVRRSLKGNYHSDARYMGTLVRSLSYSMLMASSVITTRERRFQQALESAALDELLQARAASQAKRLVSGRFTVRVATDRSAIYKDSWH